MKQQLMGKVVSFALVAAASAACGDSSDEPSVASSAPLSPQPGAAPSDPGTPTDPAASAAPAFASDGTTTAAEAPAEPGTFEPDTASSGGGDAPVPTAPPSPASPSPDALSAALDAAIARGDAPGMVALVVDRDGVVFEDAVGLSNVAAGTEMPVDAIFNLASMTKPVTSVAVMMLVEEGLIGLDDPVAQYLPEFEGREVVTNVEPLVTEPAQVTLTVRHLLSNTSGLAYGFANATVVALTQSTGLAELALPLLNEPGAEWHYSGSTRVLGQIVEQVSGDSLEDFFQARIFEPLGMVDTSYAVATEKQSRLPTTHSRAAGGGLDEQQQFGVQATPTPPFTGDGGLFSTAQDYGQFMRLFLNGGSVDGVQILSAESVAAMGNSQIGEIYVELQETTNPAISQSFPLGAGVDKFGLGFQLTGPGTAPGAHRNVGSMSWAGIFNTEFWIDPAAGIAATLLMQVLPFYDAGALRALAEFEAAVYGGAPVAPASPAGG